MSLALIVPALAALLLPPGGAPRADFSAGDLSAGDPSAASVIRTGAVAAGYVVETSAPAIYVEGESYEVRLTITAKPEKSTKLPSWLLSEAGWLVDGKPLMRRPKSVDLVLLPGQSLETKLDLGPKLMERMKDDGRDFRVQFSESLTKPEQVIWLSLPASGIDYMTLPEEQLDRYQVVFETSGGPVWIELWPDVAPNHVRNFLDLCGSGYYDGSPFHRVIPGFMVQGGKAKDGSAAPRKLDEEFNSRRHGAGVLSAARLGNDINSAGSEFFIVHRSSPHLDGSYTAFGQVIEGMDSVDQIVRAVEIHYELIKALKKNGIPINDQKAGAAIAINTPNPAQGIEQAFVVRASKSRPKRSR